jgi:hypothetical protein
MARVRISWSGERSFLKVSCTQMFQRHLGLGLRAAKERTDRILDREALVVSVPTVVDAEHLVGRAREIGLTADVEAS